MQAIPSHDPRAGSNTLKKARRALNRCPIGHSSRADLLDDVANACQTEFERLGDLKLLGEAVERRRQALDLLSPGHPDRALTLSNLAYSVQTRSEQLGDLDSLAEVIELHRQALDLRPPGNPDRSSSLDNLANALDAHFVQLGDLNSLAEAIELYRQALDSRPSWHPDRPLSLNNLATTLHTQFEQLGDLDSLTEATYLLRQALSLRPPGHSDRATSLNNLASVVHTRFEQFGDLDSLTEVIELHRQALALRPSGHPDRPFSLNNLATAVHTRFEQAGDLDSLTEAIELLRQALILRPPGHPERSTSLSNLASAVNTQFDQIGNPDSLAEAIALHRHALDLRPPGHSKRSISLDNLANALHARFEQSGDLGALEETIDLHRQALSLRSPGHPDRSFSLSNLAAAVQTQFDSDGDLDLLTQAIGLHRQALNERPPGHPEHARSLSNLGTAVQKLGDYDSRVEALALHRRALKLRPPGHPQRPLSLSLLAKSVRSRYESPDSNRNGVVARWMSFLGVGSHLEEELDLYKEGLGLCGDGNPMRMSFLFDIGECLLRTETHLYNFQDGIRHIMEGLRDRSSPASQSLRRGSRSLGIIEAAYQFSMEHTDAVVFDRHDDDDLVLQVYILVIRLLPRAASFELDASGRLHALSGAETISRDAATRAIAAGRNKEAVEMLEEGRGVFWSQALRLRAKNLDLLPANDAQELRRLFRMLELGSMHDESMGKLQREQSLEERRRVSNAAEALITEIRSRPGLSHFLLPPAFSSLVQSLPETGFVVILVTSKLSHYALVLDRTNARTTSLELFPPEGGFLSEVVQASLPRDSNASTQDKTASRAFGISKKANRRQHEPLDLVLAQLWISIVKPVIDVITVEKTAGFERPRIWWCATGELSFLPIHAAGIIRDGILESTRDYLVSSYIPTLSALTKARAGWRSVPRTQLAGILAACTNSPRQAPLHNVEREIEVTQACFKQASAQVLHLSSPDTSLQMLQEVLAAQRGHILHLACHGQQAKHALDSAFLLSDGELSIQDMMSIRLPDAVLAFLSACQTARGSEDAPDQAVHLAASMLFCGFRSVVGTMWMMDDEDGPDIARLFYEHLFAKEELDLDSIAYTLDEAVTKLRQKGVPASRWALFIHIGG